MALPGHPPKPERKPVFVGLAAAIVPALAAMAKLHIRGHEHIPAKGAFVLSPNHYSEIDPVVMAVAIWKAGRVPRFMAKASLFRVPVVGRILKAAGQISVERSGRPSSQSEPMEAARTLVREQLGVVIYPEGSLTRDPDLWPMRGKTGAVRLALAGDLPVIPMATWGVQRILPRYGKLSLWPPRKRVRVAVGPAVDLDAFRGGPRTNTNLTAATDVVMADIAGLLSDLRTEPAPAARWDPAIHGQKETGRLESEN